MMLRYRLLKISKNSTPRSIITLISETKDSYAYAEIKEGTKLTSKGVISIAYLGEIYVTTGFNGLGKLISVHMPVGYFKHAADLGEVSSDGKDTSKTILDECVKVGSPSVT